MKKEEAAQLEAMRLRAGDVGRADAQLGDCSSMSGVTYDVSGGLLGGFASLVDLRKLLTKLPGIFSRGRLANRGQRIRMGCSGFIFRL